MKVMLIGSGPVVEGQACARAVAALKAEGHQVVLLDSNPATVATDADAAQHTYFEPLSVASAEQILEAERPDALLSGVTGPAAAQLAAELSRKGVLARLNVKWLGPTQVENIQREGLPGWNVVSLVIARDAHGGTAELVDFEEEGETWTKPAPCLSVHELNTLKKAIPGGVGVTRARFAVHARSGQWRLLRSTQVLDASSAFISRAAGLDIVKLAVQLALGKALPVSNGLGRAVVRRASGLGEIIEVGPEHASRSGREVIAIIGGGPSRVGQGLELDWSCTHAARTLRSLGFEPLVIDPNPAALAGDDGRRSFAAIELGPILETCTRENVTRVLVQLGGPQAARLARGLAQSGITVLGTTADTFNLIADRQKFAARVDALKLPQPAHGDAMTASEIQSVAARIGFPLLAWEVGAPARYCAKAEDLAALEGPLWLERFIDEASQADVELLCDREGNVIVGGVVERVEQAGVHSGDAAYTLPPHSLKPEVVEHLKDLASALARGLNIVGLLNVQFAVQGKAVFVLEANPFASRTLPFVSKVTGLAMPALATQLMLGHTLNALGVTAEPKLSHCAVREAVFPASDAPLGLHMRSTGEVMAVAESLAAAFGKSQLAAGTALPKSGDVILAVHDDDKPAVVDLAKRLHALGFSVRASIGTRGYLATKGIVVQPLPANLDGTAMAALIVTVAPGSTTTGFELRHAARVASAPTFTTVEAARLFVAALEARAASERVMSLQSFAQLLA